MEWPIARLGDIVHRLTNGFVGATRGIYQEDGVPYLLARQVKNNILKFDHKTYVSNEFNIKNKKSILKEGDVLLVQSGHIGHSAVVPAKHEGHNCHAMIVMTPKDSLSGQYLSLYFSFLLLNGKIAEIRTGSTVPHLTCKLVKELQIPLPPLPEQKRIVALLDTVFADLEQTRAKTEQNLKNARELFDSYLQQVFSQKDENVQYKKIEDLTSLITKGSSPKWQGINYVEEPGVLFVTSENVGVNKMLFKKIKYVEEAFNEKDSKSILVKGDVLTNIVGASIGRTAIFDQDLVANINQAVCLIRCESEVLFNEYLSYLLNSPYLVKILHDNEINNARANLSLGFFRKLEIPVPSIERQKEVVKNIKAMHLKTEQLEIIYNNKLNAVDELKKSILQKAFSGELTAKT